MEKDDIIIVINSLKELLQSRLNDLSSKLDKIGDRLDTVESDARKSREHIYGRLDEHRQETSKIQNEIAMIKNEISRDGGLREQIKKNKTAINDFQRSKYLVVGAGAVILFIINIIIRYFI